MARPNETAFDWSNPAVVAPLRRDDPAYDGSRYAMMRVTEPQEAMVNYWLGWVVLSTISALMNVGVILVVCCRRNLRTQQFNKFVVGLAIPDLVFSGSCAVTCTLNALAGEYFGGSLFCQIQSVYCIFGFCASIWMNVVITSELYRLAICASTRTTYRALPACRVYARIGAVYLYAAFVACTIFFGWPTRAGAQRGLACLPMSVDVWSEVFFWGVIVMLMLGVPLAIICLLLYRVYRLLLLQPMKDAAANRELVVFFLRLFIVFVGMWGPTALLIWMVVWEGSVTVQWTGGSVSHLQGVVSAVLYLRKKDILQELTLMGLGWLCCAPHNSVARTGDSAAAACAASGSSHHHQAPSAGGGGGPSASSGAAVTDVESGGAGGGTKPSTRAAHTRAATRRPSAADLAETDAALAMLAESAEVAIVAKQQTTMVVIPLDVWRRAGKVPRSSDGLARARRRGEVVVFISHRWWAELRPDDATHTKYHLLCRGLSELVRRHRLDESKLVLWMDYACVDQDDAVRQAQGINSLIAFAAQSTYVLTPVHPSPADTKAFSCATHPGQLVNYGTRAWCRLESYVFLCLAEVTARPLHCYGYGLCHGLLSPPLPPRERLRPLASTLDGAHGASFTEAELPSSGELTSETDRATIRRIEEEVRATYVRSAVLNAKVRVETSGKRRRTFVLSGKQARDGDMGYVAQVLRGESVAPHLSELRLDGNLLTGGGVAILCSELLCTPHVPALRELSLTGNARLGVGGIVELAKWMPHRLFGLVTLRLAGCALESEAGAALASAVPACASLGHLDLRRNLLDDAAIEALLAACRPAPSANGGGGDNQVLRVTLDIEGNAAVSAQTFQKVSVLCGMYA